MTQSTLAALREATGSAHARLDENLRLARDPSPADVRLHLQAMFSFLEPVEGELWAQPALSHLQPELRARKTRWLRADLERLGALPTASVPELSFPELPLRAPAGLGVAYVLEGSMLGGRVLARRPALAGLRFFEGYGEDTGRLWRELVVELERATPFSRRLIVDAAVETFGAITEWLEAHGALHERISAEASA